MSSATRDGIGAFGLTLTRLRYGALVHHRVRKEPK